MTSRALILGVALIIGSPADAAQPKQPKCPAHFPSNISPCSEQDFEKLICYMYTFDPAALDPTSGKPYSTPTCVGGANPEAVSKPYINLLTKAYHLAPSKVQAALCKLRQIFVTTRTSYGPPRDPIGVWESPDRGGNVWIAIPDYILDNASSLDHAENGILGNLFFPAPSPTTTPYPPYPPYPNGRSLPTFSPSATPAETEILAVLAHELGHIMLADTNAEGTKFAGKPGSRPCDKPASACFDTYFLSGWDVSKFKQRRWIVPGHANANQYLSSPGFSDISKDVANGNDSKATMDTYNGIYSRPAFVSIFAAVSPEEDYVETYKYKTLAAAQGASLNLRISFPNQNHPPSDVLGNVRARAGALPNKLDCVPAVN